MDEDLHDPVCNLFACNCERCDRGCSICQHSSGFGGDLAPAANTTGTPDTSPCSEADSFSALTVPALMSNMNSMFCANNSTSVGFKFLGYIFHLVDTNKDGVISCAEYNASKLN